MQGAHRTARFWAVLVVSMLGFGIAGELLGQLLIPAAKSGQRAEWLLYASALALAWCTPLLATRLRRSVAGLSPTATATLAGFAAAFCSQLAIAAVIDWDPFRILAGIAVCAAAAMATVLPATTGQPQARVSHRELANQRVEQTNQGRES